MLPSVASIETLIAISINGNKRGILRILINVKPPFVLDAMPAVIVSTPEKARDAIDKLHIKSGIFFTGFPIKTE